MWPMIIKNKMLVYQSKAISDEKIVFNKIAHIYHVPVVLCIPSAHNNMASTDEDRKVETCFTTVL